MRKHRHNRCVHRMSRHNYVAFMSLKINSKHTCRWKMHEILLISFTTWHFSSSQHLQISWVVNATLNHHPRSSSSSLASSWITWKTFTVHTNKYIQWSISDIFFELSHIMHKDSLLSFLLLSLIRRGFLLSSLNHLRCDMNAKTRI